MTNKYIAADFSWTQIYANILIILTLCFYFFFPHTNRRMKAAISYFFLVQFKIESNYKQLGIRLSKESSLQT